MKSCCSRSRPSSAAAWWPSFSYSLLWACSMLILSMQGDCQGAPSSPLPRTKLPVSKNCSQPRSVLSIVTISSKSSDFSRWPRCEVMIIFSSTPVVVKKKVCLGAFFLDPWCSGPWARWVLERGSLNLLTISQEFLLRYIISSFLSRVLCWVR